MASRWCVGTLLLAWIAAPCFADEPKSVRIGLLKSLFRDVADNNVDTSIASFQKIMKREIGRDGTSVKLEDPFELGQKLADGQLDIGVFHGLEYAWVKQKHSNLSSLVLAVNVKTHFRCFLIVGKDSKASGLADLKGKGLALPTGTRDESRFFLNETIRRLGQPGKDFFAKTTKPDTVEDALDDVVDDIVQVTVVDAMAFDRYSQRKPARAKRLKTLAESADFPAVVIVYDAKRLDANLRQRIHDALVRAETTSDGKQMLSTWKLSGFLEVPADYEAQVQSIGKTYPVPPKSEK